jgi:hypothetical protein
MWKNGSSPGMGRTASMSSSVSPSRSSGVHRPRTVQSAESGPTRTTTQPVATHEMPSRNRPVSFRITTPYTGFAP